LVFDFIGLDIFRSQFTKMNGNQERIHHQFWEVFHEQEIDSNAEVGTRLKSYPDY